MRKLFFFRSSSSDNLKSKNVPSPPSEDEKIGNPWEIGDKCRVSDNFYKHPEIPKDFLSKPRKLVLETPTSSLRRSLSFSSASFESGGHGESNLFSSHNPSTSPSCSSSSNIFRQSLDHPVCCHSPARERQLSRVVDLYIDGEQQQDRKLKVKCSSYKKKPTDNGKGNGWPPPRVQPTAPPSPTCSYKEKPRSFSFREIRDVHLRLPERNKIEPESPQKVAKNVVKRLSQVFPPEPKTNFTEFDSDTPTTVEDIFENYLDEHHVSGSDKTMKSISPFDINGYCVDKISGNQQQSYFIDNAQGGIHSVHELTDEDFNLHRKSKEAEERVRLLSQELEPDIFHQQNSFNISNLLQKIRDLAESRKSLALEVSIQLQCRISERALAKEAVRVAKMELDSQTRRLEKEKAEIQSGLEKELDRRSSDWSFKLEKFHLEEQRLRERVRELAEQNVSLQRKVSSFESREVEINSRLNHSELQLKDVMAKLEELSKENHDLQKNLFNVQEQFNGAQADQVSIQKSYKEKEKENNELKNVIARLQRTCSEQEKSITGLRQGLSNDVEMKYSLNNVDKHTSKLQMEQLRLTGVEQALRREVESYRLEAEQLRQENINLLDRIRCSGDSTGSFKLDQELQSRVECLQNQGQQLFSESSQLCANLLELIRTKACQHFEYVAGVDGHENEVNKNGLDGYFLIESDMKVQSLKRGFENLTRSLQTVSASLLEKSNLVVLGPLSQMEDYGSGKFSKDSEDTIRLELKAENLLTNLLRDKLLGKQLEIDQLQSELATAIRGNEILRCETQAALDNLSCMSHKMKDLQLQMSRKNESINQLQSNLQDCSKELKIIRGILPKVSEERDLMWEEVKQYSERNMLLNSEVNSLKKKIEVLDEDILLKDGQIAILKDSVENKPFSLLSSPKSLHEFQLD